LASVNPLIVYYHDGFLRVSLHFFDLHSKEKRVHLTNTHLSQDVFKKAEGQKEFMGMNETQLREYQLWTLPELQEYLLEIKKIDDPNWLVNYLRPQFQTAMIHVIRMSQKLFFKHSGLFEIFGMDFMLDENLNVWFIECNASPQFVPTGEVKTKILSDVVREMFEIQFSYLRSRMKRVHMFMKRFHEETENQKIDWNYWSQEFAIINKNKLEKEYEIGPHIVFQKIMDKNLPDKEAYLGLLNPDCIDDDF